MQCCLCKSAALANDVEIFSGKGDLEVRGDRLDLLDLVCCMFEKSRVKERKEDKRQVCVCVLCKATVEICAFFVCDSSQLIDSAAAVVNCCCCSCTHLATQLNATYI